jgi:hypothetical protein
MSEFLVAIRDNNMYKVMVDGITRNATPSEVLEIEARIFVSLEDAKVQKNTEINEQRQKANNTSFWHLGKEISSDALSRSDIDGVANHITLMGDFPLGFPMLWKCADNTHISLENVEAFKEMYSSMTSTGTSNFIKSESMKAALAVATTVDEVEAIVWDKF